MLLSIRVDISLVLNHNMDRRLFKSFSPTCKLLGCALSRYEYEIPMPSHIVLIVVVYNASSTVSYKL